MRLAPAIFTALLALGPSLNAHAIASCSKVLLIGAWNIEWLGKPAQRKSKVEQSAEDIASYIEASKVEILALEEISVTHRAQGDVPQNAVLDDAFKLLNASDNDWQYVLFPKRDGARDPDDQWTGLAWNARSVTVAGGPWKLQIKVDPEREAALRQGVAGAGDSTLVLSRWPQAMKFSAGPELSDFVIVPLHLKSNRGGEEATAQVRGYEMELILAGLQRLAPSAKDPDVLILGDTNVLKPNEPVVSIAAASGMKDCNVRELKTYVSRQGGAPFDRIFLMTNQPESKDACPPQGTGKSPLDFKIVRPTDWKRGATLAEFMSKLSDHQMVRVGYCVQKDDD